MPTTPNDTTPTPATSAGPITATNPPTNTGGQVNNAPQSNVAATSTTANVPASISNATSSNSPSTANIPPGGRVTKIIVPKTTLADCNAIIDRYRKRQVSKITAILEIQEKLRAIQGMSDQDRKGGWAAFLEMLDNADKEQEEAASRGKKRVHNPDESSSDNDLSTPVNDSSPPKKKASKSDDTEYPWSTGNPLAAVAMDELSPICRQTLQLLSKNLEDPKRALRSLQSSPICPELPESELKAILLGKPSTLTWFSLPYIPTLTQKIVRKILQTEFKSDSGINHQPRQSRTQMSGVVWNNLVATAYTCIFPHLEPDVRTYDECMHRQFASVKKPFYSRVIHFDKAVRSRIAWNNPRILRNSGKGRAVSSWWFGEDRCETGTFNFSVWYKFYHYVTFYSEPAGSRTTETIALRRTV
jgi:hypothetical protein